MACEQNWFIVLVSAQFLFEESLPALMMSAIRDDGITTEPWQEWFRD
jgi:hypothetical protein